MRSFTLERLGAEGHLSLTWNPDDAAEVARAREEVLGLKKLGYAFFLIDGTPTDEVAGGKGQLEARRVGAEEVLAAAAALAAETGGAPKRRGRPPGQGRAVATRPMRGGTTPKGRC